MSENKLIKKVIKCERALSDGSTSRTWETLLEIVNHKGHCKFHEDENHERTIINEEENEGKPIIRCLEHATKLITNLQQDKSIRISNPEDLQVIQRELNQFSK